jgi:hypothetical protein
MDLVSRSTLWKKYALFRPSKLPLSTPVGSSSRRRVWPSCGLSLPVRRIRETVRARCVGGELDFDAEQWRVRGMKVLGFRFCAVSPGAGKLASFFDAIGFERHPLEGGGSTPADTGSKGAVFAAGDSWLAIWPPTEEVPPGIMLQVVVDDADAFAARAREQGLTPLGPTDAQNKRIYFLQAPTGLQVSIQSRLSAREESLPAPPPVPARKKSPPPPPPPGSIRKLKPPPPPTGKVKRVIR